MKSVSKTLPLKIAYVGVYADPGAPGGNNLLWTQANEIAQLGCDVEIVTWPRLHAWTGDYPNGGNNSLGDVPVLNYKRSGVSYYVISPPHEWGDTVSSESNWESSVKWAKQLLECIRPSILHQHFWQRTWFFMEAAIQLGIPTIYTAYDWGLPCRRQFLVRGDGRPCEVQPSVGECVPCCSPKDNWKSMEDFSTSANLTISQQIEKLFERWEAIAGRLSAAIVTSPFANQFFQSTGVSGSIIHTMPWFYAQPDDLLPEIQIEMKPIRLGFLGRLVPEKGLHLLLEALQRLDATHEIVLEIAGQVNNDYAVKLVEEFGNYAGHHKVIWSGWIPNRELGIFFGRIDALVVPSLWYDNAPTVLAEALAHRRPVICTDLPSMTHLIQHDKNGLVFRMNDSQQLATQISRFVGEENLASKLRSQATYTLNSTTYANFLNNIYSSVIRNQRGIY